MDYNRKIGKTEIKFPWRKGPSPPSSISDKPSLIDVGEAALIEEDRRLVNWRKWLEDREKHYRNYETRFKCDRQQLILGNDANDIRRRVETRKLIECAGDIAATRTDKYRGNPNFWVIPECLPKRGNPDLPDISMTLTRKQLNVKPEIERIGLPDLIKDEEGLPNVTKREPLWKRSEYLRYREKSLCREIKLLENKEAEIDRLAIRGQMWDGKKTKKLSKIPVITIKQTESFETEGDGISFILDRDDAIVLVIQDREIRAQKIASSKKNGAIYKNRLIWSFFFDLRLGRDTIKREIRFENRGDYAVTYRWRYGSRGASCIQPITRKSSFFFNKNNGVILPRRTVVLPVWFSTGEPGTTTEFWTLVTEPRICREALIFRFWASAKAPDNAVDAADPAAISRDRAAILSTGTDTIIYETGSKHVVDPRSIDLYLNRRIRDAKIREILRSILENVHRTDFSSIPYSSLFLESEIFRAQNPSYFYHSSLIRELRSLYDNATSDDAPSWSLSLMELRHVLSTQKTSTLRNETLTRFNELCHASLVPSLCDPTSDLKTPMVYNLLCSFVNKFEAESDNVAMECCRTEISIGRASSDAPGDDSRSTSFSRISKSSLTPRRNTRKISRHGRINATSRTSISTATNRETIDETLLKCSTKKSLLYKEVFHVTIREMLVNTILQICAVVDGVNNLNPRRNNDDAWGIVNLK